MLVHKWLTAVAVALSAIAITCFRVQAQSLSGTAGAASSATSLNGGGDADFEVPDKAVLVPSLGGEWSGLVADSIAGAGTLNLTVDQNQKRFHGVWNTVFSDSTDDNSGTLTGTINPKHSTINAKLKPSVKGACHFTAIAAVVSATEIRGNYSAVHCSEAVAGSFDLLKQ